MNFSISILKIIKNIKEILNFKFLIYSLNMLQKTLIEIECNLSKG